MGTLNSKLHGIVDYTVSILFIVSPWIFGYQHLGVPSGTIMISGAFILSLSLFTRYDLSIFKLFDFQTHRNINLIFGLFIAASPWLLNFWHYTSLPHLVLGITLVIISLVSSIRPYDSELSRTVH